MLCRTSTLLKLVILLALVAALAACVPITSPTPAPTEEQAAAAEPTTSAQLANPASQNCVDKGGTLSIQQAGDGGEYGVCIFEDNMQCEEWAMLRGDCPVGGIKVTGYVTPAATYCAITGGEYAVIANPNTEDEQGTCTFKNGTVCDAGEYYNGQCSAE